MTTQSPRIPSTAPATPERDAVLRQGWRATWLLLGFMLVNFADKAVLGLAATPITEEMDLPRSEFGAASTGPAAPVAFHHLFGWFGPVSVSFRSRS
ncbi:hypothetical protein [Streptomyces sp. NPDC047315]|uniref:hypothetical protein n=1 Tax=Streptomyces sp. NPDC047315 TaxID=3155142 RepID=UPI0034069EEE